MARYIYIAFRISFTPFTLCMFIYRYFNPFIWIFFLNKNLPKCRNENNFGRFNAVYVLKRYTYVYR